MYKKMIRIHNIDDLAIREKEVFLLLAKGQRTSEIAMQLGIKANTVSTIKKIVLKNNQHPFPRHCVKGSNLMLGCEKKHTNTKRIVITKTKLTNLII